MADDTEDAINELNQFPVDSATTIQQAPPTQRPDQLTDPATTAVVFICIKIFYDFTTLFNDLKVFNHYAAMVKNNNAAIIFYDQV